MLFPWHAGQYPTAGTRQVWTIFQHDEYIASKQQQQEIGKVKAHHPCTPDDQGSGNYYLTQWNGLPDEYKQRMMKGIVAFEIVVNDLQGKQKLSQNRSEVEKENIIEALSKSNDTTEAEIAKYMSNLK